MTSLVNPYFKKTETIEQTLFQNLKTEAIQVSGREFFYLPRKLIKIDEILNESDVSKFDEAIAIEGYLEDNTGFEGERELMTKFGINVSNNFKLIISVNRWEQEIKSRIIDDPYVFVKGRPQEGDLIYDPITKNLLEIKFVDHDREFYQIGKNYLYHLSCESFQYEEEEFSTGITELDDELNSLSTDMLKYQLKNEDGTYIIQDNISGDKDYLLFDELSTRTDYIFDDSADFNLASTIVDWDAKNPFANN